MFKQPRHRSVSSLVVGDSLLLLWRNYLIFALQATDNSIYRREEILLTYKILIVARSNKSRLVADICDIRTRKSWSLLCKKLSIQILIQLQLAKMHLKNLLALVQLWQAHLNLAIKTTCTHQRLIQNIGTICCSQDNHTCIGLETVHLGKQLIESILSLVITRESCILATRTAYRINLIDKDDAWSLLLCLVKQISNTRSTHAHKHLHKVRA